MSKISWLHVSDLHINQNGTETARLRKKLIEYLKLKYKRFDYVFITGDLRYAPSSPEGYSADTVSYIRELINTLGVPVERLFIVPGNHDVHRDDEKRLEAIQRLCDTETGYYSSSQGDFKDEDIIGIANGKRDFEKLISEIYKDNYDRVLSYTETASTCFTIQTNDLNVIHLDSTVTYSKNREKDLIIGTKFLQAEAERLPKDKTNVLLTHYSFDFLSRDEQEQVALILKENNIRLWLAGHEHNKLIRKQRDGFYEFQAGNLSKENSARSCVLTGTLDTYSGEGILQAHYWVSPDCWDRYPALSRGTEDDTVYKFNLKNEHVLSITEDKSEKSFCKMIDHPIYAVNINDLNEHALSDIAEKGLEEIKMQLGIRLKGTETREEIIRMFVTELKNTLISGKRYGCMQIFSSIVRGEYGGHLFIDEEALPDDRVTIIHFYIEDYDTYILYGDLYRLEIGTVNNKVAQLFFDYDLSCFDNVHDRLKAYYQINKIVNARRIQIIDLENKGISIEINFDDFAETEWKLEKVGCSYWIDLMCRISKIERHFGIKFKLPKKSNDDEQAAVRILSNAIDRKCCCTIPGLSINRKELPAEERRFMKENEVVITENVKLPTVNLFGYTFKPVQQYSLPCELIWKRKEKKWETKEGGIPTSLVFEVI